jgi:predicted outer membrane repeat protein
VIGLLPLGALLGCVQPTDPPDTEAAPDDPCAEPAATFVPVEGAESDLTDALLAGDYVTLDVPGELRVCPGTWWARLIVRAEVTVTGLGESPEDTVLSGGEAGTILDVAGVSLSVSNLTLDRGAALDEAHNSGGGAVYCSAFGSVDLEDLVLSNNVANDGAALYAEDCAVTARRVAFVDNHAEDDGGALTLWYSTATLSEATFSGNSALDGGAVATFYSELTVDTSTLSGNSAGNFAGAVWVYEGALTMSQTSLSHNTNTGNGGGALVHGTATLDGVEFIGNSAAAGGGLFVYYGAEITGTDCSFSDNLPDAVWAAGYDENDGTSYPGGEALDFSCAENACSGV